MLNNTFFGVGIDMVCIYSGPFIWCVINSYLACGVALCRSGMRRKKPARRSTTTVKAL
jgi:hypothetical protein